MTRLSTCLGGAGGIWTATFVVDASVGNFRLRPESISEGAARTAGGQPWSAVALAANGGAITAVAPNSPWGIYRSEDASGQIWSTPTRYRCMQGGRRWGLVGANRVDPLHQFLRQDCLAAG